jgi:hypothetical protein
MNKTPTKCDINLCDAKENNKRSLQSVRSKE